MHSNPQGNRCDKLKSFMLRGIWMRSAGLRQRVALYMVKHCFGQTTLRAGAIEGHFKGKTPRGGYQGGLVLARQCPGSRDICNPEETSLPGLPMSTSSTLFSRSGPVVLPPVPWTEKNNWNVFIFRPTRKSLLPRRPGWTDNLLKFFFWVACRS